MARHMTRVYPGSLVMALAIRLVLASSLMKISEEANVSTSVTREEITGSEEAHLNNQNATFTNTSADIQGNMSLRSAESLHSHTELESVLSSVWNVLADRIKNQTASEFLQTETQQNRSRAYEHFLKWAQQIIANNQITEPLEESNLLHVLAKQNATHAVRSLLLIGAAASVQDSKKNSPLHYAVRARAYGIIRLLLKAGADPNVKGEDNLTPLHAAVERGDKEAVRILIHEGPRHQAVCVTARVFRHVIRSHNYNALKTLIDGAGVLPKKILNIALEEAIKKEDREAIQLLLAAQVEAEISTEKAEDYPYSETASYPMSEATAPGREDILKTLLDTWGYVNERNKPRRGENPLMVAAWNNNPESVKLLVSAGASLEEEDNYAETALFYALGSEALSALIDLGANVNATNDRGRNALHNVVLWRNSAGVKVLLEAGIDKEARDLDGRTPVFSGARESTDALRLLLDANVSLNIRDNYNQTPFLHLISVGDKQGTTLLLDWFPDRLEDKDDDGNNALLLAAKQASEQNRFYSDFGLAEPVLTIVTKLVEAGADVDAQNDDGISPLLWFVDTGFIPAAEYMLSVGADKDIRDAKGYSPLHSVAEKGFVPSVRLLLRSGVDVEARDRQGRTPLLAAAASDKGHAARHLVEAKARLDARDECGRTALHWAAKSGVGAVNILLEKGANVSTTDLQGNTPLHSAVWKEEIVEVLLNAGSDRNAQDVDGSTPLLLAMKGDCEGCVRKLLQVEADVNIPDKKGVTPAMYAAEHTDVKYLKMLFKAGADLTARDSEGSTALHRATVNGSVIALKSLLEMGVTADAKDNNGKTPLHLASERNNLKALEALLAAGAEVNLADRLGRTALHWAAEKGWERMVKRLMQAGADVNAEDEEGKTPLWGAVLSSDAASAALLVRAGADVNRDAQGRTPLDLASEKKDALWKRMFQERTTMGSENMQVREN